MFSMLFFIVLYIGKVFMFIVLRDSFMGVAGLALKGEFGYSLSVGLLARAKKHALRRGVWFKTLNRVERGIIDLTVQCVDSIKSGKLAKLLTAIIGKLEYAMESIVDRLVRTVGLPLARKISNIAVSWGNRLASKWADDLGFARFLVVNFAKA
jgi:hypothetical protein